MKNTGPGLLITAAFIGPGTITTATLAGANFGYTLVWALVFSVLITFALQEMAARLGVASGEGLAESLKKTLTPGAFQVIAMILVVIAIGVGNAAYEAGNLTGAAIGISNFMGGNVSFWAGVLGIFAALVLYFGGLQATKWILTLLVLLMSLVFVVTMFISGVDISQVVNGMVKLSIPENGLVTTIAIIGTTVVPYNLFLHASLAKDFRPQDTKQQRIKALRIDSAIAIGLGGLISFAVLSTAAVTFFNSEITPEINNISDQLRPLLGDYAPLFFAAGLFAAGLTSALTAPIAAGFAVCGAMGWPANFKDARFKIVTFSVLVIGILLCFLQIKPLQLILLAQAANGLLLPVLAIFLLWIVNQKSVMQDSGNTLVQNILSGLMVLTVTTLGLYKLFSVF